MQIEFLQRKFVFACDLDCYFFDRADLGVLARVSDLHGGRRDLAGFDEVVICETNHFAVIQNSQ